MAGARVPITFRLYKGEQFVREEKLTLPVIKVGKVPASHLRLDDESVSRMHAVIEVTGRVMSIIDSARPAALRQWPEGKQAQAAVGRHRPDWRHPHRGRRPAAPTR